MDSHASANVEEGVLSSSLPDQKEDKGNLEDKEEVNEVAQEKDDHSANAIEQNNSEVVFVKKPGEFTTEVFKIEIRNIPRYAGYKVHACWYCNRPLARNVNLRDIPFYVKLVVMLRKTENRSFNHLR